MRFIVRSNLISLLLDVVFNTGLGFFCLYHFQIDPQAHGYALSLLALLYLPRSLIFFGYRTYLMLPVARWLKKGEEADEDTVKKAAKAVYEVSFLSNACYTLTFIALYGLFTFFLWTSPKIRLDPHAVIAGGFLSIAVGLGSYALGMPLNMVVNTPIANRLSLVARRHKWKVEALALPLRARVLSLAFCLTGTPCFLMLSLQAMTVGGVTQSWAALVIVCLMLACWALLSALLLNLTIAGPVERVRARVDEIFTGKPAKEVTRVPISYPDDLGVLAEGTNRMLDQLQSSAEQLESHLEQLQQANENLREATQVKGEFLASMSHELRTPLNAIIGFSKILMRKTRETLPERQFRNIEQINKSGNQLLTLVNDILDFEKIEAGRLTITPEEVLCENLRSRLLETFTSQVKEAGMQLQIEIVQGPYVLWTDPDRVHQILSNFIVNAIKYAGKGTIKVRIARENQSIRFSVTDEGPGIPQAEQESLFDAFHQLPEGKSGVGLGLAIVARLATLLGGRVELQSKEGEGSTFSFLLPSSHELGELGLGRLRPSGEGPEILVVDDQPEFLEMMHGELSEAGYSVHLARSGEMALEMLEKLNPSAVLLDIVMPGMGGWETLKKIRDNPKTSQLPVVVSSVLDDTPVGYELGIRGWLTKPVQAAELESLLQDVDPGGKVLLVDDDEPTRDMLSQVLTDLHIVFETVESGFEALEAFEKSEDIQAVILDLGLPDIDGFEVLERLRRLPRGRDVTVVAYTGRELTRQESERLNESLARVVQKHASNSVAKVVRAATQSG